MKKALQIITYLKAPVSIAPLITFRVLFGFLMLFSTVRFWILGWISNHFIEPTFHFKYYGFEWVAVSSPTIMYVLHGILILASLGVMLGFFYRVSAALVFLIFTYCELIDLTYYLNHYYFVSLVSFWLIFAPAHRYCSVDAYLVRKKRKYWRFLVHPHQNVSQHIPRLWIIIFQLQLGITYFYAGIAKLNSEWLFDAMPLRIWLPAHYDMPLLGFLMPYTTTAYAFSWAGMLYDIFVPFALFYRNTRIWAYLAVVGFHSITGYLFQIGVFPVVMILLTLIFFDAKYHQKVWARFTSKETHVKQTYPTLSNKWIYAFSIYFCFQLLFPLRVFLYKGNMFWTEEGYRFGWRVMLMEKAGTATFYVKNSQTGREGMVINSEFLNAHQEKQMAMQPDMILQYAKFLQRHYASKENPNPIVRAEVYVTLNGRRSQLYFNPELDLTQLEDTFAPKQWIHPLED